MNTITELTIAPNKKVIDLKMGDKNIQITVILIKEIKKIKLKNGNNLIQYLVGDETACINCCFYDDSGISLKDGDILYITGAYATIYNSKLHLYQPKQGHGLIYKIDEFFLDFSLNPNMSELNNENSSINNI